MALLSADIKQRFFRRRNRMRLRPWAARLLAGTQPHACPQKFLRIDGVAIDAGFVVQMRTCGAAGRTDGADYLTDFDDLADLDIDLGEMAVAGRQAIAVINLDHAAIAALPARRYDLAAGRRAHGVAGGGTEIEPGVHRRPAQEGIAAYAEAGGEFDFADHRLAVGHQRKRAAQSIHLHAGD